MTDGADENSEGTAGERDDSGSTAGGIVVFLLLLAVAGGLVWAIFPEDIPARRDPELLYAIFANKAVLVAARIVLLSAAVVLLFGGLYIAVSVVIRMKKKQWLQRFGPFEANIAEAEENLEEIDPILDDYIEALDTNEQLERTVEERNQELARVYAERDQLREELGRLERNRTEGR